MQAHASSNNGKILIGWREYVALPDWGITVRAKIDTGARTSALHVEEIELLPGGRVRFEAVLRRTPERSVPVEAQLLGETVVRPSSGEPQARYVVAARMRLGGVEREIHLGLVSREHMLCRMLVGRRALEGRFIVDPDAKYLHRRKRRNAGGAA
jgi:hypothetical protein